jgi:hypothetical protein
MRATLILDDDVAALLREEVERSGLPFKQVVNQAIRLGLRGTTTGDREPYRTRPYPFHFKTGIDLDRLNQLVDELEVEALREKLERQP